MGNLLGRVELLHNCQEPKLCQMIFCKRKGCFKQCQPL